MKMEISMMADKMAVFTAKQGVAFGKSLLNRWDSQSPDRIIQSSAVDFVPVDATVRSSSHKTIRRIRRKRRTKRVSYGGDSGDGGDFSRFLSESGNDGGLFGFGGGDGGDGNDGGGKGWNYGGGGRGNWDESSSWSDPAMEFVYEVICWIALSNCVHFAFKRIARIVTDVEREKMNLTLSPVC